MADIRNDFVGIKSPNPFWLASAPPTDKEYNVRRAFEAGWGGVVWKTLGMDGPHRHLLLRAIDHIAANSDTQVVYVSHSVGEMPACINQWLEFVPGEAGFEVVCREGPP